MGLHFLPCSLSQAIITHKYKAGQIIAQRNKQHFSKRIDSKNETGTPFVSQIGEHYTKCHFLPQNKTNNEQRTKPGYVSNVFVEFGKCRPVFGEVSWLYFSKWDHTMDHHGQPLYFMKWLLNRVYSLPCNLYNINNIFIF